MEHFMQSWCIALSTIRDDIEKEDAFQGLCAIVRANPSRALSSLVLMCKAIVNWHEIRSKELHNTMIFVRCCMVINRWGNPIIFFLREALHMMQLGSLLQSPLFLLGMVMLSYWNFLRRGTFLFSYFQ